MSVEIVVDAGSTNSQWAVLINGEHSTTYKTDGWNATINNTFPTLLQGLEQDLAKCQRIHFYGAGINSTTTREKLSLELQAYNPNLDILAHSDLMGAARALFGIDYGIAGIIGTGSNIAYYEDGKLEQATPSLGYLLSDEGSASKIGSLIVKSYFYGTMPDHISNTFAQQYPLNKDRLLKNIYSTEKPNAYLGQFTRFLSTIDDPWKDKLLIEEFSKLIALKILPHKNFLSVPIGFVGSIAHAFSKQLEMAAKKYDIHNVKILGDPIDALVEFHKKKSQ